ncbi:MAG: guanylate kinase [Candidatus Hydrogenedentota bacterium]|nr:MAG: guanylate kinase [Candidatus Hydrogenedentota bacterium]
MNTSAPRTFQSPAEDAAFAEKEDAGTNARRQGRLFIISAPSGAGKSTVVQRLLASVDNLRFSVSTTTRPRRPGEIDGRDYHFTDRPTFEALRAEGEFIEWAEVHGNLYGTRRSTVEKTLENGIDLLLDIDTQGCRQILETMPTAVSIFIMPPSLEVLEQRLRNRGTDDPEVIATRLKNARAEIEASSIYRYIVINDDLDATVGKIQEIIEIERRRNS